MPEFFPSLCPSGVEEMIRGYLDTIEFTDAAYTDDECHKADRFSDEAIAAARGVCEKFRSDNRGLYDVAIAAGATEWQIGSDLWYTRNGHGVGFWERKIYDVLGPGERKLGDELSGAADVMGVSDAYLGDDGKIHLDDEHRYSAPLEAAPAP